MTIALGMIARHGLVIAADTEMSWGVDRKTDGSKIAAFTDAGVAIAGAGNGDFIDALTARLHGLLRARNRTKNLQEILKAVRRETMDFYRQNIAPLSDPDCEVSLLIGIERGGRTALWKVYKTTVQAYDCAAIGAGSQEADILFGEFFGSTRKPDFSLVAARATAAYMIHIVKERVQTCGKRTEIVLIGGSERVETFSRGDMQVLDWHVSEILEGQVQAAQLALGFDRSDEKKSADAVGDYFLRKRREYLEKATLKSTSALIL